jgi:hypothetical protein
MHLSNTSAVTHNALLFLGVASTLVAQYSLKARCATGLMEGYLYTGTVNAQSIWRLKARSNNILCI